MKMIYDTTSNWVVLNTKSTEGAELISDYDVSKSTTAVAKYIDNKKTVQK